MSNMGYCRHENTARDLNDVWEQWEDFDADEATKYELKGRERIIRLVREMHEQFEFDGTYDEADQ